MFVNNILLTDSYKVSQHNQYHPDTEFVYSYLEARSGAMFPETVFFGLQKLLHEISGQFFTLEDVDEAEEIFAEHFGRKDVFNRLGWDCLYSRHGGSLPIEIRAVPEGMVIPNENVLMSVVNTDARFPWITSYLETFLVHVWYPCTVATLSREVKKIILKNLEETGDPSTIDFKLHDFGYRGATGMEAAGIGGLAHLVNFKGTDTLAAIEYNKKFYKQDGMITEMPGFSIPASEHSTMTSWGGIVGERDAFKNMLDRYPEGLIACVSDSYDIYNAIRNLWGDTLKHQVMNRNGCLVMRPDSGEPVSTVLKCLEIAWERFGGEVNSKGYKVLDPHVRLIQGDGIGWKKEVYHDGVETLVHTAGKILDAMKARGFSGDNIAFGSGGGLLQDMNRDTQRFAFKCSATRRNGVWYDVWKDPITSKGKASKRGSLKLVNDGGFETVRTSHPFDYNGDDIMSLVFKDGELKNPTTMKYVRENVSKF